MKRTRARRWWLSLALGGVACGATAAPADGGLVDLVRRSDLSGAGDLGRDGGGGVDAAPGDAAPGDAAPGDAAPGDAAPGDGPTGDAPFEDAAGAIDAGCTSGCPNGIVFAPGAVSPIWGNAKGGSPFGDACPPGQALVGLTGKLGGSLDGVGGLCGQLSVVFDAGTMTYGVNVGGGASLPYHGSGAATFTRHCGLDQMVVTVSGRHGQLVDGVTLGCAGLVVQGGSGAYSLARGPVTQLPYIGGAGGGPFPEFACPATQVATIVSGRAGNSLDALGVACSAPSLTLGQ